MSASKIGKKANPPQNGKMETVSNIRNQPTPEQIRIAQITSDRSEDPEIVKNITQITELTGRTSDEALTALHDCDYDVNRAVEKLLESQEDQADEWQEIGKKKKLMAANKGSPSETPSELKTDKQTEQEMELNLSDAAARGRRDRAPPRFHHRGRGRGAAFGGDRTERIRESNSRERDQGFESTRGRRRGNFGEMRGRGGRRGGRSMHSNKFEPQIDMWTNESAQNGDRDATMGAWNDITDEWTADEWNGSLKESCVFTPSVSSRSAAMYVTPNNVNDSKMTSLSTSVSYESSGLQTQIFSPSSGGVSSVEVTSIPERSSLPLNKATASGPESLSQQFVAKEPALAETTERYGSSMPDQTMYMSHFNKEATECIKNAMGIGRSSMSQNLPNVNEMNQPTVQSLSNVQQSSQIQRVKQQRPRLPPPSKIPSMAVEMPDSMNSGQLDVQFGNWDMASLATENISFMSDIGSTPDYIGVGHSSSQSASISGSNAVSQHAGSSFDSSVAKPSLVTPDGSTQMQKAASKCGSYPAAPPSSNSVPNEPLLTKVVPMSVSSSSGLLTSVAKPIISGASQLGFNHLVYSSSSDGSKLPIANGPSHYGSSFNYQSGVTSLVTMPSDYNLSQSQMQYTYGDAQRFGASSSQVQAGFGPTSLPPGYGGGPMPSQLHYSQPQQGQVKSHHVSEKPSGSYSISSDISVGLYQSGNEKQSAAFPTTLSSQPFDSGNVYQGTGFQSGGGGQSGSTLLPYPGVASFQGMQIDTAAFEAGHYPNQSSVFRPRDGQGTYDIGMVDSPRSISAAGTTYSSIQGQGGSQAFSSSFGSQSHVVQSSGTSFGVGQGVQSAAGSFSGQGQQMTTTAGGNQSTQSASGSYSNQRQSTPSVTGLSYSHVPQTFGNQLQAVQGTTTVQSSLVGTLVSSNPAAAGKLVDNLSKLNVKDSPAESVASVISSDGSGALSASVSTTSASSSVSAISTSSMTSLTSKSLSTPTAKSSMPQTSKPLLNLPPGMPAAAAMMNHNYMIGQPPGFQLAAFGYPTAQQPVTYSFDDFQMMQQRFSLPTQYYDMPLPTSSALPGRESTTLAGQSYTGNDVKLTTMDVLSPVNAQAPQQQPQAVTGNQQAYINHALHPAYSYYYPGAAGIMPMPSYYAQMVPVGGLAIPSVTNPAMAGTTSTTQYQKPAVYGSHAYAIGGQTQDFSKTFGGSQVPNKPGVGVAAGIGANSADMMAGAFGKTHMQVYDRGGFHGGTPPPFSMAMPSAGGTQGGTMGAPAVYNTYMPLVPHQQSHSQLLHHAMPQDSSVAGRTGQATAVQQKVGGNKPYGNTYWGS